MPTFGHITVETPRRTLFRNGLSFESPAIDCAYKSTTMQSTFEVPKERQKNSKGQGNFAGINSLLPQHKSQTLLVLPAYPSPALLF